MNLSDLFPEKLGPRTGKPPRWSAKDLLLIIRDEVTLIGCTAGRMAEGAEIPDQELERVGVAVRRIHRALGVAHVD